MCGNLVEILSLLHVHVFVGQALRKTTNIVAITALSAYVTVVSSSDYGGKNIIVPTGISWNMAPRYMYKRSGGGNRITPSFC